MNEINTNLSRDLETIAIDKIIDALDSLAIDRKVAILKYIYERIGGNERLSVLQSPGGINPLSVAGEQNFSDNDVDIKTFLRSKNPENKYQQLAVLAFYLRKYQDIQVVDKKIIEEANRRALGRTIDNISLALNDAKQKYNFFGTYSGGKKNLLAYGEDIVNALPDQQKVKELMKSVRGRKKHLKNKKHEPSENPS